MWTVAEPWTTRGGQVEELRRGPLSLAVLVSVLLIATTGRDGAAPPDPASPAEVDGQQRDRVTQLFDRVWSYATLLRES